MVVGSDPVGRQLYVTLDTCCGNMNASSRGEDLYFLYDTMDGRFSFGAEGPRSRTFGGSYADS